MDTEYKYDVFISYSRKDYVDENKVVIPDNPISAIKDTFDKNDITYWFDEEGIYSGQAFVDIITEAIAVSKSFVFISSKHSNQSKWTKSEILEAFDSDKAIIPFKIDNTDYDKSLKFFLRPLDFISYYENNEKAIDDLIRSVNKVKDEIAEEEKKKQAEAQQKKIKENIKELVEDYQRLSSQQETILSDIFEQSHLLGVENKLCPVCEKPSKIDALFCDKCGWSFHPLFAIDENYSLAAHKIHLSIFKAQWKSIRRIEEEKKKIESLTSENEQLKESFEKISEECKKRLETIEENKFEIAKKEKEIKELNQLSSHLKSQLKDSQSKTLNLEKEKRDIQERINLIEDELAKTKGALKQKEEANEQIQKDYDSSLAKIEELEEKLSVFEEQSEPNYLYDIILHSAGDLKLSVVKLVKELTGLDLKEAKELVDSAPNAILVSGVDQSTAETFVQELREIGAVVEMRYDNSPKQSMKRSHYGKFYRVLIHSAGSQKLAVTKLVKELTGLGLKEAKDLVDSAPYAVLASRVDQRTATEYQQELEKAGATVYVYETR